MNIHMKPFILLLFLSCCLFSCSEDEIKPYHGDQYLYFSQLKGTEDKSINVSFNNYPLDDELTVKIAMGLVGDPFSSPAPYKIGILTDKTTALAENYSLPEAPSFKANSATDELEVKLIKTENLTEDVSLLLKIEPNDYFGGSILHYGTYSRAKYRALVQYGGEEALNFGELNASQRRRCALRLKDAIAEYGLKEENGKSMTVPIY